MTDGPSPTTPAEPRRPTPDASWRERAEVLAQRFGSNVSPAHLFVAGVAVVVAIGAGSYLLRASSPGPPVEMTLPLASSSVGPAAEAPPTTASRLVVQAAGAVAKPGVYTVAGDARVNDLIAAAGGLAPDADPDQVELAAALTDGERVYVPRGRRVAAATTPSVLGKIRAPTGRSTSIARVRPISNRSRASGRRWPRQSSITDNSIRSDRSTISPRCVGSARRRWSSCDRW